MPEPQEIKEGDIVTLKNWFVEVTTEDGKQVKVHIKAPVARVLSEGQYLIDVGRNNLVKMSAGEISKDTNLNWEEIHE